MAVAPCHCTPLTGMLFNEPYFGGATVMLLLFQVYYMQHGPFEFPSLNLAYELPKPIHMPHSSFSRLQWAYIPVWTQADTIHME